MYNTTGKTFSPALLTDLYELTMMQGYLYHGLKSDVVFDMFFRRQPFHGGFSVFAGLEDLLGDLEGLKFTADDLAYLESLRIFKSDFLDYLRSFVFRADIYAMEEGTIVFPGEPLVRVHGSLIEAQLIESLLLNTINFQTLIATKAARIYLASGQGILLEFGLRRAHGPDGSISASRAAFIGGAAATSNTLSGKLLSIPVKGTMAHSWIMAFPNELEAFQRYAQVFPDSALLLVDTYNTLASGVRNAIRVLKDLKKRGHRNFGIRLDSGDLDHLSKEARRLLDTADLRDAKIAVSNDLDEETVHELKMSGAPIDIWGVGTNLVTADGDSSLTGVYKLVARKVGGAYCAAIKVSDNPAKATNPGIKQVCRFFNRTEGPTTDLICLADETDLILEAETGRPQRLYHPMNGNPDLTLSDFSSIKALLSLRMRAGKRVRAPESLDSIRNRVCENLIALDSAYTRLKDPHTYRVALSHKLWQLKESLLSKHSGGKS